jgi:hypothetical protein
LKLGYRREERHTEYEINNYGNKNIKAYKAAVEDINVLRNVR